MNKDFIIPAGMIGKFAIVKLWPEIKTAEDECIARLKIAAINLGLECIEIHADGRKLENPTQGITKKDVDFVLHLHYDTPKLYDAFSFVALWNPTYFYHEWGYARTSRNLLTHDDFVSCSSPAADDHVNRLIRKDATHLPPLFNLYHSIADIVHLPSLGECKLFYAGINWEALSGKGSRHQELLKRLDKAGNLRIFGPTLFQGVNVWDGYKSYVSEIPFDGVSMIDEIAKTGIALVLSSQAHKDSELMSNRLFESVAAGALVICDENNFAKKFFGDSLLYIDSRCEVEEIFLAIEKHLVWAQENSKEALAMIAKAQAIFREKFSLNKNLSDLYVGLSDRKAELIKRQIPDALESIKVGLYLFLPEYSEEVLNAHIASVVAQEYQNFSAILVIDKLSASQYRKDIKKQLNNLPVKITVLEIDFFTYGIKKDIKIKRKVGAVISDILNMRLPADAVVFVAPNEKIFSNHIQVLAGSLIRNPEKKCAATSVILSCGNKSIHGVHEAINFRQFDTNTPMGYARFIFRVVGMPKDYDLALPYLDRKSMAILAGEDGICSEIPSTVILYLDHEFPSGLWDEGQENNLIASFSPKAFTMSTGHEIVLPNLSLPGAPDIVASQEPIIHGKEIIRFSRDWFCLQLTKFRIKKKK
jgi:hypothetical protein